MPPVTVTGTVCPMPTVRLFWLKPIAPVEPATVTTAVAQFDELMTEQTWNDVEPLVLPSTVI